MAHRSIYREPDTGVPWYVSKIGPGRWRAMREGGVLPIYGPSHEQIVAAIKAAAEEPDE